MDKMYEEGGLATDGVDVDPVSGNDIPAGSNAEDVRDDVDAKLSSGEYVVPADVVKYFGVAYFEKLRAKAKEGLGDMEEDGRIGGEHVEDEKTEHTIDSDLEMMDGYATGGLVPGADVNGIIDRIKAAAKKDPSISNLLKSKGIFIQAPEHGRAAVAPVIEGQATPKAFAEGGTIESPDFTDYKTKDYESSMDPYAHTPGFSIAAGAAGPCPPGYRLDPNTQTCVPITGEVASTDDATAAAEVDTGIKTKEQLRQERADEGPGVEGARDPNGWMDKYDYTDPDTLTEQTMSTLGKGEKTGVVGLVGKSLEGLVGSLGGGLLGKAFNGGKYGEAMANAAVARANGNIAQAMAIEAAAANFAQENNVNTKGLFSQTSLAQNALTALGLTSTSRATSTSTSSPQAPTSSSRPTSRSTSTSRSAPTSTSSPQAPTSSSRPTSRPTSTSTPTSTSSSQAGAAGASTGTSPDGQGGQPQDSWWGGMAKGGLVQKRSKAKATPAPKTKSNKKGLGRR